MYNERTIDELIDAFNAQAKAEGRYDSRVFWEVPARPGSIRDIPETEKSKKFLAWLRERRLAKKKEQARSGMKAILEKIDRNLAEQEPSDERMEAAIDEALKHVRSHPDKGRSEEPQ